LAEDLDMAKFQWNHTTFQWLYLVHPYFGLVGLVSAQEVK